MEIRVGAVFLLLVVHSPLSSLPIPPIHRVRVRVRFAKWRVWAFTHVRIMSLEAPRSMAPPTSSA